MYTFIVINLVFFTKVSHHNLLFNRTDGNLHQRNQIHLDFVSVNSHARIVSVNRFQVHTLVYNIFNWFRRLPLSANMRKHCDTIILLKLLKVDAKVIHLVRYIAFKLCSIYPTRMCFIKLCYISVSLIYSRNSNN